MTRRADSRWTRLIDDPFVNGLVTLLVVFFAVFVSYNANNGLPFVPKYKVSVDVPDAGQLVRHAEVRVGGARVGQVLQIHAVPRAGDVPAHARLDLALNSDLKPLRADTKSEVRVASILGGKYVSLVPGRSRQTVPSGGVLSLKQAKTAVDLDEAFRVFDPKTRAGLQETITELGNGLAGRGMAFNRAIGALAELTPPLQRVLTVLADPDTNLSGFLHGAATTVDTLVPVSDQIAAQFASGARTLGAINAAGDALGRSLDVLPDAEQVSTTTLTHLRPALRDAAFIGRAVQPAAKLIPSTFRGLDKTLRTVTPVARDARTLAKPLGGALVAVQKFAANPDGTNAIKLLGSTDLATFGASGFVGLGGLLAALSPAQFTCNSLGVWARNLSSALSEGDRSGAWLRMTPVLDVGQGAHVAAPSDNLHFNAYPNLNENECEAGNEPYLPGKQIGNPAGNQAKTTAHTAPPASATARAARAGLLKGAR